MMMVLLCLMVMLVGLIVIMRIVILYTDIMGNPYCSYYNSVLMLLLVSGSPVGGVVMG